MQNSPQLENQNTSVDVRLTVSETDHLLNLLYEKRDYGSYYGNRKQYHARTERLLETLNAALKVALFRSKEPT